MTAMFKLSRRSLDELEQELVVHAQRINAEEYAFLELVREFDIRQGWKAYQFNNCAEWLNMKCSIVVDTACEKVRVTSALFDLPRISRMHRPPMLILGADFDHLIPASAVEMTGRAYGIEPEFFAGMGHGLMLEADWRKVAQRIDEWLQGLAIA